MTPNAIYLSKTPLKDRILRNIAGYYGASVADIEAELADADAEAVFEYIGNDTALRAQVYREFKTMGL